MCCLAGNAQNKFHLSEVKSIVNFGIDYSLAKVFGGKDSGYQYWITYADINEFFISKSKTFDIGKRLGYFFSIKAFFHLETTPHTL